MKTISDSIKTGGAPGRLWACPPLKSATSAPLRLDQGDGVEAARSRRSVVMYGVSTNIRLGGQQTLLVILRRVSLQQSDPPHFSSPKKDQFRPSSASSPKTTAIEQK